MSTFETVSRTLGNVKPETRAIAREVFEAAKAAGHEIWAMWGYDPNASNTEHHSGLALDLMVRNEAAGDWIRDYIWKNRARLRLRHVIWEQHITSTVTKPGERRLMANRGSVTANHYDHNHAWFFAGPYVPPSGQSNQPPTRLSIPEVATQVIRGSWGNGDERRRRLTDQGYNYDEVQAEVERQLGSVPPPPKPTKPLTDVAHEVIAGRWGNGADRVGRLTEAGYNAAAVQAEVNRLFSSGKSVTAVAREVLQGKWGNGEERVRRLTAAGFNAKAVQAEVNRLA